jgi:hypothetical protein
MKKNIKGLLSFLFLLVVLVGTFSACKSTSVPLPTNSQTNTEVDTKILLRDTIFKTQKDSSYYRAWLECQEGKVVISQKGKVETIKGRNLKPPKVQIKENYLTVDCEAEAQKLLAQWKDVYRLEKQTTTLTNTVLVEKELTWWQKFQIWCGRVFMLLVLYWIIKLVLKIYKPI